MSFCYSCGPQWSTDTPLGVLYNWFLISLGFFLPTLVIVASNVFVLTKLRKVL